MYRSRSQDSTSFSDIFVMLMEKADGSHELPLSSNSEASASTEDEAGKTSAQTSDNNKKWGLIALIVIIVLVVFGAFMYAAPKRPKGRSRKVRPSTNSRPSSGNEEKTHQSVVTGTPDFLNSDTDPSKTDGDVSVTSSVASSGSTNLSQRL
jgi:hypothetical protein